MFKVEQLCKKFKDAEPIHGLNAEIHQGDVISLIGPSGTGKSTFLRCLNMLDPPTEGKIIFKGEDVTAPGYDVPALRKKVGMVFQSFNLFNHMTIIENVMKPQMKLLGRSRREAYDRASELLNRVGLGEKYLSYPAQLSGGQKQRAAIARAMAMDVEVLLLDEPTSALDPTMVGEVEMTIRDLAASGVTMMIVTHDMEFAKIISNRIFYMDEGVIYEEGSPAQILEHPQREKTIEFIRKQYRIELEITEKGYDFPGLLTQMNGFILLTRTNAFPWQHVALAAEELGLNVLRPLLKHPNILLTVEYRNKQVYVQADYNGEKMNVLEMLESPAGHRASADAVDPLNISLNIIRACYDEAEYEYRESELRPNRVILKIK